MKRLVMIAFLFLACTLSGFSQTEKDLAGKWKFKEIVEKADAEVKPNKVVRDILQDLSIDFSSVYYALNIMDQTEKGAWALNGKKIDFISQQGKKYTWDIKGYKDGLLHLAITNAEIVLSKVPNAVVKK